MFLFYFLFFCVHPSLTYNLVIGVTSLSCSQLKTRSDNGILVLLPHCNIEGVSNEVPEERASWFCFWSWYYIRVLLPCGACCSRQGAGRFYSLFFFTGILLHLRLRFPGLDQSLFPCRTLAPTGLPTCRLWALQICIISPIQGFAFVVLNCLFLSLVLAF